MTPAEPDGIPCGLSELMRYRHNRQMAEIEHWTAETRRITQEMRAMNERLRNEGSLSPTLAMTRELCDLISAQLGKRVSARSSMPGSGGPARMAEPPKRTLMQRIRAYLTGA